MEKGWKTLLSTSRAAQRRTSTAPSQRSAEGRGISDHNSDSGIGLGSDTEMEVGHDSGHTKSASWHAHPAVQQRALAQPDHVRTRSLPQLLPLYQPPPPITQTRRRFDSAEMTASPQTMTFGQPSASFSRYSPDSNGRGGISIQSMLLPAEEAQHA